MRLLIVMIAVACVGTPLLSQTPAPPGGAEPLVTGGAVYVEEDMFLDPYIDGLNSDRNYTGGLGIQLNGRIAAVTMGRPLSVLDRAVGMLGIPVYREHRQAERYQHSIMLSGVGFTPDSLNNPVPQPGDRPFSSLIALSGRTASVDTTGATSWYSELTVGVLGTHVARNAQRWIHQQWREKNGTDTPLDPTPGWVNQISAGGEPTAMYMVGFERLLGQSGDAGAQPQDRLPAWWQISWGGSGSVGYYTQLSASATVRAGVIRNEFWTYRGNPMGNTNVAFGDWLRRHPLDANVFMTVRPRLVGYNALLEGQFRESTHTQPARPGVLDFETGVNLGYGRVNATWIVIAGRSPEFRGTDRWHTWASFFVSVR